MALPTRPVDGEEGDSHTRHAEEDDVETAGARHLQRDQHEPEHEPIPPGHVSCGDYRGSSPSMQCDGGRRGIVQVKKRCEGAGCEGAKVRSEGATVRSGGARVAKVRSDSWL